VSTCICQCFRLTAYLIARFIISSETHRAIQKGMELMSEVYKEKGNKLYLDDIENVVNPLEA